MTEYRNPINAFNIPFTPESQLCSDLSLQDVRGKSWISSNSKLQNLPSQPSVSLAKPDVLEYLEKEMMTSKLNRMAPHMWLLAKPSSDHCSPLHNQFVRGRNIVISEDPDLHLVWIDNRIFMKPIPPYLLSWAFWQHYLNGRDSNSAADQKADQLVPAVLGYMRSYFFLVRHESDFRVAVREHLIPGNVTHEDFMVFISGFGKIQDSQVSPRYHFGELRLSRLNRWSRILLGMPYFHKVAWRYSEIFARYYAPYLFIFSIFTIALSAMQVGVGARVDWHAFQTVSGWFAVVTLAFVCLVAFSIAFDFIVLGGREVIYAVRKRFWAKKPKTKRKSLEESV